MSFNRFYTRLMLGDLSLFAEYPIGHPYFNTACYYQNGQVINLLVDACLYGSKPSLVNLTKKRPWGPPYFPFICTPDSLHQALIKSCYLDDIFFLQHLIEIGAPQKFLLHNVAFKSQERLLFVLRLGIPLNINEADDDGMTPLMFAAKFGYADAVRELLRMGADPSQLSYQKAMNAYDFAISSRNKECIKLLKQHSQNNRVDISQTVILRKIVKFLQFKMRTDPEHYPESETTRKIDKFKSSKGICSGLSAIFAMKARQGRMSSFVKDLKTICSWDGRSTNKDVDTIFSDIIQAALCMQSSSETGDHFSEQDWDKLYKFISNFDIRNEINFGIPGYNTEYIEQILKAIDYDKRIIRFSSHRHSISITKEGDNYIVYDPNARFGHRSFKEEKDLISFMRVSLFKSQSFMINIFSLEIDNLSPSKYLSNFSNIASNILRSYGTEALHNLLNYSYDFEMLVDSLGKVPYTLLLICAKANDIASVRDIIKFKSHVDMKLPGNQASIIAAAVFSKPEIIQTLLDNFVFLGRSLILAASLAMKRGMFSLLPQFAAKGVMLNTQMLYKCNIGEQICSIGTYEDFKMVVGLGYTPDSNNSNMLFNAYKNSGIDFVISLITDEHLKINAITPPRTISFPDFLLQTGRLSDYEKLVPHGAKPNKTNVYSPVFICNIYIENGLAGIQKLEAIFADLDIKSRPELMELAATSQDQEALKYFSSKGINYTNIDLIYIYSEFGIDAIKMLNSTTNFRFADTKQDIIYHLVQNNDFHSTSILIKYKTKLNKFSLNYCLDILVENKRYILLEKLAKLATEQGIPIFSSCKIIFSLLRDKEFTLLRNLLRINTYVGNQRKILKPIFESSTKRGFPQTIIILAQSVPREHTQSLLDEMLVLSVEIENFRMVSLYLSLGANPLQVISREEHGDIELTKLKGNKEIYDILKRKIAASHYNPFLTQSCKAPAPLNPSCSYSRIASQTSSRDRATLFKQRV